MQVKKRLRKTAEITPFKLKKDQLADAMTDMLLKGHSVKSIADNYDIPPRVVDRLCKEHLIENNPSFHDRDHSRMVLAGTLQNVMQALWEPAVEEKKPRELDLLLKTLKQYGDATGVDNAILRESLKEQGVIRHEHSGSIDVGVVHELGQNAAEKLALFKSKTDGNKVAIPINTHSENTRARSMLDKQLSALPQADETPDLLDILEVTEVEDA